MILGVGAMSAPATQTGALVLPLHGEVWGRREASAFGSCGDRDSAESAGHRAPEAEDPSGLSPCVHAWGPPPGTAVSAPAGD